MPRPADRIDLARLGWDDDWRASASAVEGESAGVVGRVARVDRGLCTVLTAHGPARVGLGGDLLDLVAGDGIAAPVTGDWVLLREWSDRRTTLETVLPRRATLLRATPSRRSEDQVLAANLTVAAVVVGLVPDPVVAKIERLLAVAWGSGAVPALVLTKADLVSDAYEVGKEVEDQAPGVEVVVSSTLTGEGLERLRALVGAAGTMALLGSSGGGKSSLVNALVGALVLSATPIRDDGRGRHTSVRRELVGLPGGGAVIDTPGLRGVGLAAADRGGTGVGRVFADVAELAAGCRFGDCRHVGEPGCAVAAALRDGRLSPRRYAAWQKMQRELAWVARRAAQRRSGSQRSG